MKKMLNTVVEFYKKETLLKKIGWAAGAGALVPGVAAGIVAKSTAVFIGVIVVGVAGVALLAIGHFTGK